MIDRTKLNQLNEGRQVAGGRFMYGGFPKVLKEQNGGAVEANRDDNLGDVAITPNEADPITWEFEHRGYSYPSKSMLEIAKAKDIIGDELSKTHEKFRSQYGPVHYEKHMMADPQAAGLVKQWQELGNAERAHPHYAELVRGHPSKRGPGMTPQEQSDLIMGRDTYQYRKTGWTGD